MESNIDNRPLPIDSLLERDLAEEVVSVAGKSLAGDEGVLRFLEDGLLDIQEGRISHDGAFLEVLEGE